MSDKSLTEAAWKAFAKGKDIKDSALLKALADLAKAERAGPDAQLKAIAEADKQVELLRKLHKGDKSIASYLDDMSKALTKEAKEAESAAAKAKAEDDEDDDSPAALTSKMVALVRMVPKGVELNALIGIASKQTAVMLSRRTVGAAQKKAVKDYLNAEAKFVVGTCLFEAGAHTFVVMSQAAGLAKKIKAAIKEQTGLNIKVRVRGEDPDDVDEDLLEEGDAQKQGGHADAVAELKSRFDAKLKALQPSVDMVLKAGGATAPKVTALFKFAQDKSASGDFKAAMEALAALAKLLEASPPSPAPTEGSGGVKPDVAFNARLKALLPAIKKATDDGVPQSQAVRTLVAQAGVKAKEGDFSAANLMLDEVETLLSAGAAPRGAPGKTGDSPAEAEYRQLLAQLTPDYEALMATGSVPALRDQQSQMERVWDAASKLASAGDFAKALGLLKPLANADALRKLKAAKDAALAALQGNKGGEQGGDQQKRPGSLVQKRTFMLERWKKIPIELKTELNALQQQILANDGDPDPDGLVALMEGYLNKLLQDTQDALDDAVNKGDTSAFKGLAKRIEGDQLVALLLSNQVFDGSKFRKVVIDAMQEIETAMTA